MTNIETEKELLKRYGRVVDYLDLKNDEIKTQVKEGHTVRPMYFIRESDLGKFSAIVHNEYSSFELSEEGFVGTSELNYIKKYENFMAVELCVEGMHFIPDKILKDNILFFYQIKNIDHFFIVIKDEYKDAVLNREHSIFGIIDFSRGTELLFAKDCIVESKMKEFYKKIDLLARKYKNILFLTISDSVIIKHSFKIIGENNQFKFDNLEFEKIIELFKEIRKITKEIFEMNVYGVFSYGMNKCSAIQSDSKNVFHTGILSYEFKKLMQIEEQCRKLKKGEKKGDIYLSFVLYKAFRFRLREKYKLPSESFVEPSAEKWSISSDKDIIAMEIPDEPIVYKRSPILNP